MKPITGTFLDEITHDIPSQNWGRAEWEREFALYPKIGLDTVVIIRAGYQDKCIFPSRSVPGLLPVREDLAAMFLDLAEANGLRLYFGLFDSGNHWLNQRWEEEVDLNRRFIQEVAQRYGSSCAFAGWYICHETSRNELNIIDIFRSLGTACKEAVDRPVLISPFPQGAKQFALQDVMTLRESMEHWETIFAGVHGAVDICAFQDGQIHYRELPEFHAGVAALGKKHGITIWSNVETFDRDMPIKFPPADWRYLRLKLEEASKHVEKVITFEIPHFMSPHSCYPAAHNLFQRYCEEFGLHP